MFGKKVTTFAELIGQGDLRSGCVIERSDWNGIEGNLLARPVNPHHRFPGLGRGILGHYFVGALVEANLRALDPNGVFSVGVEHDDIVDGELEVAVEESVKRVFATEVHRQVSGPHGREWASGKERGRGLTGWYEEGNVFVGSMIRSGPGTEGLSKTGGGFSGRERVGANQAQARGQSQNQTADKVRKASHGLSVETGMSGGQESPLGSADQNGLKGRS